MRSRRDYDENAVSPEPAPVETPVPASVPREHLTDSPDCWCNPEVLREGGSLVIVHKASEATGDNS